MEEVLQYALTTEASGKLLDGGKNYQLHLPPNIPAVNFWSLIVYDSKTRLMISTDQPWPSVHSQIRKLLVNRDGSVDTWFGPKAPDGKEHNWVKTIPGKEWNLILRLYGPFEPDYDTSWRPMEIIEVNGLNTRR